MTEISFDEENLLAVVKALQRFLSNAPKYLLTVVKSD